MRFILCSQMEILAWVVVDSMCGNYEVYMVVPCSFTPAKVKGKYNVEKSLFGQWSVGLQKNNIRVASNQHRGTGHVIFENNPTSINSTAC